MAYPFILLNAVRLTLVVKLVTGVPIFGCAPTTTSTTSAFPTDMFFDTNYTTRRAQKTSYGKNTC